MASKRRKRDKHSTSLTDLFDLRFRRFVTPLIVKIIYVLYILIVFGAWLLISVLLLTGTLSVFLDGNDSGGVGVPTSIGIMWGVFSVGYFVWHGWLLLILRLTLESVIVLFRIEEHLDEMAND
ncbi:MAG: DUF4282 domain-containing protein [Pirellulales bacterium]